MECRPATSLTAAQLAQLFNASFEGYPGVTVAFTDETVTAWCEQHLISIERSYVFFDPSVSDEAIAFGLMAVREDKPGHARLGAMGVMKIAQGRRVGSRALETIVEKERERGVKVLELECIQTNPRALRMYQNAGFKEVRELLGWETDVMPPAEFRDDWQDKAELEEVTVEEVDVLVRKHGAEDLPWQSAFVSKLSMSERAFRLGHAWCVVSNPEDADKDTVKLGSLFVEPEWRGRGEGTRLVKVMMGRFGGKKWSVRSIFPKEMGDEIARRVGAKVAETLQFQMRMCL